MRDEEQDIREMPLGLIIGVAILALIVPTFCFLCCRKETSLGSSLAYSLDEVKKDRRQMISEALITKRVTESINKTGGRHSSIFQTLRIGRHSSMFQNFRGSFYTANDSDGPGKARPNERVYHSFSTAFIGYRNAVLFSQPLVENSYEEEEVVLEEEDEEKAPVHDNFDEEKEEDDDDDDDDDNDKTEGEVINSGTSRITINISIPDNSNNIDDKSNSTNQVVRHKSNVIARRISLTLQSMGTESAPTGCNICLMKFEVDEKVCWSRNPDCIHGFHKECIVDWLMNENKCPICRRDYIYEQQFKQKTDSRTRQEVKQYGDIYD